MASSPYFHRPWHWDEDNIFARMNCTRTMSLMFQCRCKLAFLSHQPCGSSFPSLSSFSFQRRTFYVSAEEEIPVFCRVPGLRTQKTVHLSPGNGAVNPWFSSNLVHCAECSHIPLSQENLSISELHTAILDSIFWELSTTVELADEVTGAVYPCTWDTEYCWWSHCLLQTSVHQKPYTASALPILGVSTKVRAQEATMLGRIDGAILICGFIHLNSLCVFDQNLGMGFSCSCEAALPHQSYSLPFVTLVWMFMR